MEENRDNVPSVSTTNILALNDDCFYHLYSYLSPLDWTSLRDTCKRLRAVSDYWFQRKKDSFVLTRNDVDSWFDVMTFRNAVRMIQSFGRFMTRLTINRKHFGDAVDPGKLVPVISQYCSGLVELKLVGISLDVETLMECDGLFGRLQRFVPDEWDNEETLSDCLMRCVALRELVMMRPQHINGNCLVHVHFNRLEAFTIIGYADIEYQFIKQFILNHLTLTKVRFLTTTHIHTNILRDLADAVPHLTEVSVKSCFQLNVSPITRLQSLKKVEIGCLLMTNEMTADLLGRLAQLRQLEHLLLASFRLADETIERLKDLRHLRTLGLVSTNNLDEKVCKSLAVEFTELTELHVVQCEHTTFSGIKEFIAHSANLKRIVFNRFIQKEELKPSLTVESFLSVVGIQRSKPKKDPLKVFLDEDDLYEIRGDFTWAGSRTVLSEHSNVVKLLPLEEQHRSTLYVYGSRYSGRPRLYQDLSDLVEDYEYFEFGNCAAANE